MPQHYLGSLKSRDLTSFLPLFWRDLAVPIFFPNVQVKLPFYNITLKKAKREKMMRFLSLVGPCRKRKKFFWEFILSNISH